jgi:hypothetical protein
LKVTLEILEVRQGILALVAGHREDSHSPGLQARALALHPLRP